MIATGWPPSVEQREAVRFLSWLRFLFSQESIEATEQFPGRLSIWTGPRVDSLRRLLIFSAVATKVKLRDTMEMTPLTASRPYGWLPLRTCRPSGISLGIGGGEGIRTTARVAVAVVWRGWSCSIQGDGRRQPCLRWRNSVAIRNRFQAVRVWTGALKPEMPATGAGCGHFWLFACCLFTCRGFAVPVAPWR